MSRIGVFICHCGHNIAGTVDVAAVAERVGADEIVAFATDYKYMCSDPGQELIREMIAEHDLDGVVVAACSPAMHETTFRRTVAGAGLNPYRCESANIREQVSWVHEKDKKAATTKAAAIARSIAHKVGGNEPLEPLALSVTQRVLVIGGGIAGLQAALDVADAGYPVYLVEKEGALGGKMARLSGTYLNFDAAPALLQKTIERVERHPYIQVLTNADVAELSGYVGNFKARVETAEAVTTNKADSARSNRFSGEKTATTNGGDSARSNRFSGQETAEAVTTNKADSARSNRFSGEKTAKAVTTNQGISFTLEVGAVVVATGWERYDLGRLPEYGGGGLPDVVDGLAFEQMLAADTIRRPSDGRVPREVVFVQCAGSRDPEHGVPYCSKICCMVTAKQARLYRERVPEGQAYVFYIDIRSAGKGYEEFVQETIQTKEVLYLRGKVSKIFADGGQTIVWGVDTLSGRAVEIAADLVVLATPMLPADGAPALAQRLRISTDAHGFFNEAHPKLRPVETLTAGIFLAGAGQGPKDIPETIAQASGAAAKVLQLFSHETMTQSPLVATVVPELCAACGACVAACPYGARELHPVLNIATVNAALCQSCGACVVACPNKASQVHNWRPGQMLEMVDVVMEIGD